ncbi:hypothetical protein F5B22DRAFT_641311 [Xylaria bambusicola]|uniref:uncharacterized protein n=1 Tax=Xylaria bambusicola TaxID=326684 RepID=UPI002007334E|nr:uncharacterized protein F5B22DRAFT_641311 [Xylaria bambusicola]KAI0526165.1 hypothetical protein F5B22DRAFT_641311 [Xylaria bambusicola]
MQDSEIAAYVAFPFTLLVVAANLWFAYHHYRVPAYSPIKLCGYTAESYVFVLVLIALFVYVAFETTLFVLTLVDLYDWATWCWRWSIGGAFLFDSISVIAPSDSLPTLPCLTIPQPLQLQLPRQFKLLQHRGFLLAMASIEAVFVIIGPAIPKHAVAQYLTVGLILYHTVWTVLRRRDWLRLGTSCAELFGVVLMFWTNVAFVVFSCSSAIIYLGAKSWLRRPLSLKPRPVQASDPYSELQEPPDSVQHNIVFMGDTKMRSKSLQEIIGWGPTTWGISTLGPYVYPTRNDTYLFNMSPLFIKDEKYRYTVQESIAKNATAFVLAVDLCHRPSLVYLQNLAKSMAAQPGLLVVYRSASTTTEIIDDEVRDLAGQHGWLLETPQRVKDGFEKLLQEVDERSRKQD